MSGVVIHGHGFDGARVEAAFRAAAEQQMRAAMREIQAETVRRAPFRTGHLRRSITSVVTAHGNAIVGTIGTAVFYAPYLEMGTGLYGPRNRRIVPVSARALRFPAGGTASAFGSPGWNVGSGGATFGAGRERMQGSAGPGFRLSGQQRSGKAGAKAEWTFRRSVRGIHPLRFFADSMLIGRGAARREIQLIPMIARRKLGMR